MQRAPWEFHPDLLADRLAVIARALLQARNAVLDRREPDNGDDPYATGTRAYSWQCHAIRDLVFSEVYPWLSLINGNQEFIFRIGAIPVRFYRGSHDRPHSRTLRQTFPELTQAKLNLGDEGWTTDDIIWRFAIETDIDGEVDRIMFCAFQPSSAHPICVWEVPINYSRDDVTDDAAGEAAASWADGDGDMATPKVGFRDHRRKERKDGED